MASHFILYSILALYFNGYVVESNKRWHQFSNGEYFLLHSTPALKQINNYLQYTQLDNPQYAAILDLGVSAQGNSIKALQVSSNIASFGIERDVVLIDAGIHAREWLAPATAITLIQKLIESMRNKPQGNIAQLDFLIIPVLNVDGYKHTHSNRFQRLWRKNMSGCKSCPSCKQSGCCGVDLNRNFESHWIKGNQSEAECYENYSGSFPASELETNILMRVVRDQRRIKAYVTLHAAAQYILYPYAHSKLSSPRNQNALKSLAFRMSHQIQIETGRKYETGTFGSLLYEASGTSMDWVYDQGIDLAFTIELPPRSHSFDRFYVKSSKIPEASTDMWIAISTLAEYLNGWSSLA